MKTPGVCRKNCAGVRERSNVYCDGPAQINSFLIYPDGTLFIKRLNPKSIFSANRLLE